MSGKFAVVQMSSTFESTALLAEALDAGYETHAVIFPYSARGDQDRVGALAICEHYSVPATVVDLVPALSATAYYSGHSEAGYELSDGPRKARSKSYVPMRNTIFASLCAALLESICLDALEAGVEIRDARVFLSGYSRGGLGPFDAGTVYSMAVTNAINAGAQLSHEFGISMSVETPFGETPAGKVVERAHELNAPLHLTYNCQYMQPEPCRRCYSCIERAEAFAAAGIADPAREPSYVY